MNLIKKIFNTHTQSNGKSQFENEIEQACQYTIMDIEF